MKKIFFLIFIAGSLFAQSNAGRSFNFALSRIPWDKESHVYVAIFSENVAKGRLSCGAFNFEKRFALKPGEITTIEIPRKILIDTNERVTRKSITVESDEPVVVNVFNNQEYGSDGFLALPDESLGTEYYAMCYPGEMPSFILVAATESNTGVNFEFPQGGKISVSLMKGETYLLKSGQNEDYTGVHIVSTEPIAVMSGNMGAFIPQSNYCCANHLVEMLPPVSAWGKVFFTTPFAQKKNGDVFKVIASEDETTIYLDDDSITQIGKGKYFETILPSDFGSKISSKKPILLAQFSTSYQFDTSYKTDPFMTLVQPYEQYQTNYAFIVPELKAYQSNFINIAIRAKGIPSLRMNDKIIDKSFFENIDGNFASGRIPVTPGGYRILSNEGYPFSLNVYGYDNFDAYGYMGGSALGEHYCEKLTKERLLIGVGFSYPFSYGAKVEFGYDNWGIIFSYIYFPEVGQLDGTPPPDSLKSGNYSHTFLISPNYTLPINCNFHLFAGPYFSVAKRSWENVVDGLGYLKGSFFEYYGGIHAGAKYFIIDKFLVEASLSIGIRTVHRFSDEKIIGSKFSFFPFIGVSYQLF